MLFPEEDSPLLKAWIVQRLGNTSDADADVLADFVLALLHDDSDENVKPKLIEEMNNFLTEDTSIFANELFEVIKHRSYVPGAPPPLKPQLPAATAAAPQLAPRVPSLSQPALPNGPSGGGRKRGLQDRGDSDAPNGREQFQGRGRSYKQPRRGGGFGARKGYIDPDRPQPIQPYTYSDPPAQNAPPFGQPGQAQQMPQLDLSNPMEAMRQLQQLSQQMGLSMPTFPEYSQQQQQGYRAQRGNQQRRRGRCRDYDTKGYCARGQNCMFEHSDGTEPMYNMPAPQASGQIQLPPEGRFASSFDNASDECRGFDSQLGSSATPPTLDGFSFDFNTVFGLSGLTQQAEYDPNTASMMMTTQQMPQFPQQPMPQSSRGNSNLNRDSRHGGQHQRRRARAPFSADGPVYDRTQTKVVVENIPEDNFDEDQVRGFFSQFGNIEEISMQPYKRLAIVKYDNWGSANAAYKSPKVIFDNRFVKVFWYKDERHADVVNGGASANGARNGISTNEGPGEPPAEGQTDEIDMDEFVRKQEDAQKAHEEKMRKKEEIDKQRAELEKKQKELRARQEAERQRLLAKITSSTKGSPDPGSDAPGTELHHGGDGSVSSAQTEALKATLAKLQEEAKAFGLDPDANPEDDLTISTYSSTYGRGTRAGFFRGRGGIAPRARASFRGGARGGRGNIHAAYAAFSLDNRPRKVAISGVDFSAPEKDEALRQHLFSLGEGAAEIQITSSVTHISFSDRRSAEKFYYSTRDKSLPGVDGEVELSWVANSTGRLPNSATSKVDLANGSREHGDDGLDSDMADVNTVNNQNGAGLGQGQEAQGAHGDLDYDVAGENEWDIA